MPVTVATFNMENLFTRAAAMSDDIPKPRRKEVLTDFAVLNALIAEPTYTASTKKRLKALLAKYKFSPTGGGEGLITLNRVRGQLINKSRDIVAAGRADWVGWFELVRADVTWKATYNTGRVVSEIQAEVLLAVEVEDRLTLQRFNDQVLAQEFKGSEYPFNVLIDGNDARGIDIGLFSQFPISAMRTNIHAQGPRGQRVFSRDCPVFDIQLPGGQTLVLLGNHLKSKGYGSVSGNDARRLLQATSVNTLYQEARNRSEFVVVAGDLNDTPESDAIEALVAGTDLKERGKLRDAMMHPRYTDTKQGTYKAGTATNSKIDYLLLSPALWDAISAVGVERRGIYAPRAGSPFDTVTSLTNQASDHGALWVTVDL